jgi:peptidoglycan/LPS O-acetylase OafA/YrhL
MHAGTVLDSRVDGRMTAILAGDSRTIRKPQRQPLDRTTLGPLTGLRFVAALAVVLFHFWGPCLIQGPALVYHISKAGHVGVSLFFVLSGFILAYTYLNEDGRLLVSRRQFWWARVARVYPLYLFALLLDIPHFHLKWISDAVHEGAPGETGNNIAAVVASNLAMVQSWTPGIAYLWNAPAWSVSVEAFFYAAFPFIAAAVIGFSRRSIFGTVAILWVAALIPSAICVLTRPDGPREDQMLWDRAFGAFPLFRLPEFLIGVAAGREFVVHVLARARETRRAPYRIGLCALGIVAVLACGPLIPERVLHNGLLAPLFAVLIYDLACDHGVVGRVLGCAGFVLLGEASYAIYILQVPMHALARALARSWSGTSLTAESGVEFTTPFIVAFTVLLFLVAVGAMIMIERPARRWLRRRFAAA